MSDVFCPTMSDEVLFLNVGGYIMERKGSVGERTVSCFLAATEPEQVRMLIAARRACGIFHSYPYEPRKHAGRSMLGLRWIATVCESRFLWPAAGGFDGDEFEVAADYLESMGHPDAASVLRAVLRGVG